jgi:HK97 family phage portal protein
MATILGGLFSRLKGGWKTVGAMAGDGAFASSSGNDWSPDTIGVSHALRLSAYFACVRLLSETMGSLTLQLTDQANNPVLSHDLYGLMAGPNQWQTGDGLVGAMAANRAVFGNGLAYIKKFTTGTNQPYELDFYATDYWDVGCDIQGHPTFKINGEPVPYENVLHWPGMSLNGFWGLPTLAAGVEVLSMQTESNRSAGRTFANGLRAGGFFELPENRQAFSEPQLEKFRTELGKMALPQNTAKWLPMLPGMKAVANQGFRIDPVTAELLQSRYFGIEEICRFMGVPPPLIGHTDKASSWASSLDSLNQFLVTYTVLPAAIRFENEIKRKLLGRNHQNQLKVKFNMDSLLRTDIVKRFQTYEIGVPLGVLSPNDARATENLPPRPGGDQYAKPTPKATPSNQPSTGKQE